MVAKKDKKDKKDKKPVIPPARERDDPGGEVYSVDVYINNILVYHREAVLYEAKGSKNRFDLKTDDGEIMKVKKADTARDIAAKLLKDKGGR